MVPKKRWCRRNHDPADDTNWILERDESAAIGVRWRCKECQRLRAKGVRHWEAGSRGVPRKKKSPYVRRADFHTHCRHGHEYAKTGRRPDGKCAECNRVALRRSAFRVSLRKEYGITVEEFMALGAVQGWRCALCDRQHQPPVTDGSADNRTQRTLVVDHDHDTGLLRGLLCRRCNAGLGAFGDNIQGLQKAIAYLQAPAAQIKEWRVA